MSDPKWKFWGQSQSSIGTFETCPRKFKASYLTRETKWVETEANKYGNRLHEAMENAFQYNTPVPDEFAELNPIVDTIKSWPGRQFAELKLAVDADWQPCDWSDRYLGAKIDLAHFHEKRVFMLDWKSGRVPDARYFNMLQLDVGAALIFSHHVSVDEVRAGYYYTRHDVIKPDHTDPLGTYQKIGLQKLKDDLDSRIGVIKHAFDVDDFPAKQNGLCRAYCDVMSCPNNGRNNK